MTSEGIRKALHQVNKIRYRPVLIGKIASAYFKTLVLRKKVLRVCEFSITPACQSRCDFCYAAKFHRQGEKSLTVEEIRSVWTQAKSQGAFCAVVFGGEPLLHPNFLEIMELLEPKKHIVTVTTNAIALTEDIIIELKRLGVFLINLSLNSLDPALNDRLRGYPGHYEKVMEAIRLCKAHGLDVFIPVATSKPLFEETLKIVEFAKKNGAGVTINLMCAMGRAEGQHEELFDEDFWLKLRKLYDANPGLRSDFDVNLDLRIGCPAGFEKIHVAPHGDVTGCSMNPASFGNVRELPLSEILGKMRKFHHFAKRHPSCIVAVDKEYVADYMDEAAHFKSLPYPIELNTKYAQDRTLR